VSTEAIVLALSTVVRPTSAAAVVAILATRHPRRLLVAYIAAGLTFSLTVGAVVVVLLQGVSDSAASFQLRPVAAVALGVLALGYAGAVGLGWLPRRHHPVGLPGPVQQPHWMRERLQNLSLRGAATAGVLTHLPGLVYLAALNAIAGSTTRVVDGMLQVAIYNAIWFSLAIVALALSVYRPGVSQGALDVLGSWTRGHRLAIVVVCFSALGGYLVLTGILGLLHRSG
jgi:Sap, sulfolipid-1-addressing protein